MDLIIFAAQARRTLAEHGPSDWTFEWDRAVRRNGCCHYNTKTITMSRSLTAIATQEEASQTLLHEIAHALVGAGHGHGRVWLAKARSIGYTKGRSGTREDFAKVAETAPYTDYCPNGHESPRWKRKPAKARATSCGRCSPRFDSRYLIKTRPTGTPVPA